jgi:hypothetical protein
MTPRRSSGGPQCAFEENKKERERAERGSERGSRAERKSRRALPLQSSLGPRGHREALLWRGEGGDLGSRGARSVRALRGGGLRPLPRWIAFLIKDSQQLFGIFTASTHVLTPAFKRNSLQVHLAPRT